MWAIPNTHLAGLTHAAGAAVHIRLAGRGGAVDGCSTRRSSQSSGSAVCVARLLLAAAKCLPAPAQSNRPVPGRLGLPMSSPVGTAQSSGATTGVAAPMNAATAASLLCRVGVPWLSAAEAHLHSLPRRDRRQSGTVAHGGGGLVSGSGVKRMVSGQERARCGRSSAVSDDSRGPQGAGYWAFGVRRNAAWRSIQGASSDISAIRCKGG